MLSAYTTRDFFKLFSLWKISNKIIYSKGFYRSNESCAQASRCGLLHFSIHLIIQLSEVLLIIPCKENSLLIKSLPNPSLILLLVTIVNKKLWTLLTRSVIIPLIQILFTNSLAKKLERPKKKKKMKVTWEKETEIFFDHSFTLAPWIFIEYLFCSKHRLSARDAMGKENRHGTCFGMAYHWMPEKYSLIPLNHFWN